LIYGRRFLSEMNISKLQEMLPAFVTLWKNKENVDWEVVGGYSKCNVSEELILDS
jgi:hypothetical protein